MTTNCSAGYGTDNLFRFVMPIGPLNVPPSKDCYMHIASFQVLSWILITGNILFLLFMILDYPINYKPGKVVNVLKLGIFITISLSVVTLFLGIYASNHFRLLNSILNFMFVRCAELFFIHFGRGFITGKQSQWITNELL